MCRKNRLIAVALASFGAGLLLGCLISAGFLRLVLGAVFFAVGVLLLFR